MGAGSRERALLGSEPGAPRLRQFLTLQNKCIVVAAAPFQFILAQDTGQLFWYELSCI